MPWETLQTLSHTLAWTLLHFLWQGALIGVLYLLATRCARSTRQRHGLALAGLLLVLAVPALTVHQLQQRAAPVVAETVLANVVNATPAIHAASSDMLAEPGATGGWTYLLVFAWLSGALLIALRLLRDWQLLRRAIRTGGEPSGELLALLEQQIQRVGVGRRVRLRLTARISSAGVYGWLRPVILLPTALALCMPRDQLETLLAHELAHIRRADFLANSLALLARTLLYFHPVVHRICRDLERSREQLCDDLVVSLDIDRIKYARALSTAESFRQQVKVPVPLLTATGGELSERVHRILDIRPVAHSGRERAPLLLALTAVIVAIAGLGGSDTTRLLSVTRPAFQAAYLSLAAARAPDIGAVDLSLAAARPQLPELATFAAPANTAMAVAAPAAASPPPPAFTASVPADTPSLPPLLAAATTTGPDAIALAAATATVPPSPTSPGAAPARIDATSPTTDQAPPRVLRRVQPDYPRNARWDGIEGSVTLGYRIGADGTPENIQVLTASPPGLFEEATIQALQRWRFAAEANGEYQQSFDFLLGERGDRCETRIGTRICRPPGRD